MSAEDAGIRVDFERLTYAKLDGPAVVLAYQADDKAHVSMSTHALVHKLSFTTSESHLKLS